MTIYIFLLLFLGQCIYIQKPRNPILHGSIAKVSFCDFLLSIRIIWEFTRYGLQEKTERLILSFDLMLIGNGKVLRLYSDTHAALPQLAWAVKSHFPFFLHCERRKTGSCSFTAPSSAVNWIFQFSSAPRGGKLEIAFMLRAHVAEIFQSGFLSFFPFFCLLVGLGSGLSSTKRTMDACE